jgi:multiple sugar transport system substrate-binding protein
MGSSSRREFLKQAGMLGAAAAVSGVAPHLTGTRHALEVHDTAQGASITFWDMDWGGVEATYQQTALELIGEYEKAHPGVTISYRIVPWTTFYEVFATAIAAGTTPDISTGATFQGFQYESSLLPLNAVVEKWKANGTYSDLLPGTVQAQTDTQGRVTGLPWEVDARVIWYRADLLAAEGIDPPTTMNEILTAAAKLGKAGKGGYGFSGDTLGYQMLESFFFNNGGSIIDAKGRPSLVSTRNIEVCEWIQAMVREGGVPKQAAGWLDTDVYTAFQNGEVSFFTGEPRAYLMTPTLGTNYALLRPPTGFHGDKGTVGWVSPIWLYKSTSNVAAATDFLEWWLDNEKLMWSKGTMTPLPARTSFYTIPGLHDARVTRVREEWLPVSRLESYPKPATPWLNRFEGESFMPTLMQDVLRLQDPKRALATAQNALAQIM